MKNLKATVLFFLLFCHVKGYSQSGWFSQDFGVSDNLHSVFFVSADLGFAVGETGTILKTEDSGANWQNLNANTSEDLNAVYFFDADSGIVAGNADLLLRTTDGGNTWSQVDAAVGQNLHALSFHGRVGICGGTLLSILTSPDAGRSWSVFQSGLFGGPFNGAHMVSDSVGFLAGENAAFQPFIAQTTDGGANWNFIVFLIDNREGELFDVRFLNEDTGFVVSQLPAGRGGISRTTDGGTNWTHSIFDNELYGIDFPSDRVGFAVGLSGTIVKTDDGGMTWAGQGSGTASWLRSVAFVDTLIGFVVGDGGTILKTTTGGEIVTDVEDSSPISRIPTEFQLVDNFPNPFNPGTSIVFGLPRATSVSLNIYNVNGQLFRTLVDTQMAPGFHSVFWNGTDERGRPVASGWYIYSLRAAGVSQSKVMLLLR